MPLQHFWGLETLLPTTQPKAKYPSDKTWWLKIKLATFRTRAWSVQARMNTASFEGTVYHFCGQLPQKLKCCFGIIFVIAKIWSLVRKTLQRNNKRKSLSKVLFLNDQIFLYRPSGKERHFSLNTGLLFGLIKLILTHTSCLKHDKLNQLILRMQ